MNPESRSGDRIFRTAAWLYVLPRAGKGLLLLAVIGLAAFLVLIQIALSALR
jgi:hypothetical protein